MSLQIDKLNENIRPDTSEVVRVKQMGNIIEIMYSDKERNGKNVIKKLDNDTYIDLRTGEVKEFNKIENRACSLNEVRKTLGRLRDYLNTNITDVKKCKWVTLTYAENMTDPKQLKKDFEKFNKRMQYYLKENSYEYIVAMEPQGRGAWHAHLVMIFENNAPYIDNKVMAAKWGHGFTVTKKLEDVDNVGAYLTAYLGDMDIEDYHKLTEAEKQGLDHNLEFKEVEVEVDGKKVSKAIIKGGRLHMYPPKFNIYRCSKGIKSPVVSYELEFDAQKKASAGTLTFEKTIKLSDADSNFENIINYRHYNLVREEKQ
jgi:hypothetical protein